MVTVSAVLASTGSVARPRPLAHVRRAALLPLAGLAAALAIAALAAATGWLTPTVAVAAAGWPLALLIVGGHPPAAGPLGRHQRRGVLRAVAAVALVQWPLGSRTALDDETLLVTVAALAALTLAGAAATATARRRAGVLARTLVVGDQTDLRVAMSQVAVSAGRELDVVGGCTPEELDVTLDRLRPDLVVVVPGPRLSGRRVQRLAWQLENGPAGEPVPMLLMTGLEDVCVDRRRPLTIGGLGVTELMPARQVGTPGAAKVLWERAAAAAALVVLVPLLLGLALLVKLDSPGPALFRQTRVGRGGGHFTMLKLRTMTTDAEAVRDDLSNEIDGAVLFKVRRDPRVTRVGRILRRYSLDELPQLINVVRGEMSLVGPRPALPNEVASYDLDPRRRLVVRPGLTGLWQVSGRSDLSWRESVRLDLDYVDNWSLRRDLAIVSRTLHAVLGHRGAY
ncbi:exopolysaccharide biosynthesis polyprenyl glycosylphosphotransferase [Nocardioides terrae]|uniref:Exopolysaccharide biosynthesis polyprenyl glycosylphosphotransferase n=1 Tax=Nocardioides terrae TaxID=574651 RepID=A0A1I1HUR7_9ACTN|nr:sugar transferase [Nocardioides terrae]SFC27797.1 exopolysaccharide biosynthesis polyprenyl glycosylphosphotransferase [Nocardioides terrae]